MSDLPPEYMEEAMRRDERLRDIDFGSEVEAGLREGRPLFFLLSKLREDADDAMQIFATVNPADTNLIMGLQARVFRFRYLFDTLDAIVTRGRTAQRQVMAEDEIGRGREDGA